MEKRAEREENLYREVVGPPRNLPEDHPDRWQWEYKGTKEEREELLDRLDPHEPEPVEQDALFE